METASRHLLCEYWGCRPELLDDARVLEGLLTRAAAAAGATVVAAAFHPLAPHGVSGVVLLEESHLSIHTWPEQGYAAADVFTCGDCQPERAHEVLRQGLGAEQADVLALERGGCPPRPAIHVRPEGLTAP